MRVSKPLMVILGALLYCAPSVARAQEAVPVITEAVVRDFPDSIAAAHDQQPAPPNRHRAIRAITHCSRSSLVDFKYLPSKENLYWLWAAGGLAAAVHPVDDNVNQAFLDASSGVRTRSNPARSSASFRR
jgi:hypothetical protein